MKVLTDLNNGLAFLHRGEFKEFLFRLKVYFKKIDLSYASADTLGLSAERSHAYADSGGTHLEKILNHLNITKEDSIVDFGSGKGGALITFARYPFFKIMGVELLPELVAIAHKNLKILRISTVTMVVSDAAHVTDLNEYTHFYFYSPFPRNVMADVIGNLETSLRLKPRKITIIYCNPEFHDCIVTDTQFSKTNEFHHNRLHHPVYLYSNKP